MTPEDLIHALYSYSCPVYYSNDGSRTRQGCACCWYCDEVVERDGTHADDCPWLTLEALVSHEDS